MAKLIQHPLTKRYMKNTQKSSGKTCSRGQIEKPKNNLKWQNFAT